MRPGLLHSNTCAGPLLFSLTGGGVDGDTLIREPEIPAGARVPGVISAGVGAAAVRLPRMSASTYRGSRGQQSVVHGGSKTRRRYTPIRLKQVQFLPASIRFGVIRTPPRAVISMKEALEATFM